MVNDGPKGQSISFDQEPGRRKLTPLEAAPALRAPQRLEQQKYRVTLRYRVPKYVKPKGKCIRHFMRISSGNFHCQLSPSRR